MESKLVFISHSHHDAAAAKALKNFLAAAFVELRPQTILMTSDHSSGLRSGDLINERLMQEARDAPVFISILSPIYLHSTYCIAEYAARWGAGKSIHCLRLADLSPAELSGIFAGRHAPLITEEAALWKLLEDIRGANGWKIATLNELNQTLGTLCSIPTTERQDFNAIHKRLLPESTPVFLNAYGLQSQLSSDKVFQDFDCLEALTIPNPSSFCGPIRVRTTGSLPNCFPVPRV
ncbi:toll/interleukin-1 receptor domain-containing protein [Novipirellula sp.]|uniref:toll/interleukin-1 receptor domain-containing protein n=1 Tax=Novipirellula sp. TaxID=2795430 RepID=UPI00356AF438